MWLKLLLIPILMYGVILTVTFLAQTGLLFPTKAVLPAGPLPAETERLELSAPSGHRLYGSYIPAAVSDDTSPVILGFGGNAWNADEVARLLHGLYPEAGVVAFHYRGYAPSEGRPSAAALLEDGPSVHDFVQSRFGNRRVVAVGFSIGVGVAAALLARRPLEGAILVTPFDSLTAVASDHYPWLPVGLLLQHRMDPAEELKAVQAPVALITGEHDTIIRSARAEALRRAVPNLVSFRTIGGAGHNDIYRMPAFREAMRQAMADILSLPDGSAALVPCNGLKKRRYRSDIALEIRHRRCHLSTWSGSGSLMGTVGAMERMTVDFLFDNSYARLGAAFHRRPAGPAPRHSAEIPIAHPEGIATACRALQQGRCRFGAYCGDAGLAATSMWGHSA